MIKNFNYCILMLVTFYLINCHSVTQKCNVRSNILNTAIIRLSYFLVRQWSLLETHFIFSEKSHSFCKIQRIGSIFVM